MNSTVLCLILATFVVAIHCKSISNIGHISPYLKLVATADGKSFFADPAGRDWFQARAYCQSMGMKLASITTKNQADALKRAYHSQDFSYEHWVSGRDANQPRQFSWESGSPVSDAYIPMDNRSIIRTCVIYASNNNNNSILRYYECNWKLQTLCET